MGHKREKGFKNWLWNQKMGVGGVNLELIRNDEAGSI